MYSQLFKNRRNQESFHNGLLATSFASSSSNPQLPVQTQLSNLEISKHPIITQSNPIPFGFIDVSSISPSPISIQTLADQIIEQTEDIQQLSQSNVLPIQVEGDTTSFQTPVYVSHIRFPDETVQSTALNMDQWNRVASLPDASLLIHPLPSQLQELIDGSGQLYSDASNVNALSLEIDAVAYVQSFEDVSASVYTSLAHYQSFVNENDFSSSISDISLSLTEVENKADAIHNAGLLDLSLVFEPLSPRLSEWVITSEQLYRDASSLYNTEFIPDAATYVQTFRDISASLYDTSARQQFLSASELTTFITNADVSFSGIQGIQGILDSSVSDISGRVGTLLNIMSDYESIRTLLATADASVESISLQLLDISTDVSMTQIDSSLNIVMGISTNTRYSGLSIVRQVLSDSSLTAFYMAPYSSGTYKALDPLTFLTNQAIIGETGLATSFAATKPLVISNPEGTRGIRIPLLSSDTSTRTELWSDLNISGGSMNVSGMTCSQEVSISRSFNARWDATEPVQTAIMSGGNCNINWNQGQTWHVTGVTDGNFGIQVNNFPTDTSKVYNLRLLYDSGGGYGSTINIDSSDISMSFNRITFGRFMNQHITLMQSNSSDNLVAWSTIEYYSSVLRWVLQYVPTSMNDYLARSIAFGNNKFVVVTHRGSGSVSFMYYDNNWNVSTTFASNNVLWNSVTFGNDIFVAVSTIARVATSTDGINWIFRNALSGTNSWSVAFGNNIFVAVSTGGNFSKSSNGTTWDAAERIGQTTIGWTSIAFGNGIFVAISQNGRIATYDGSTWTIQTGPNTNGWTSVTFGKGIFVAISSDINIAHQVITSTDGIVWTLRTSASFISWKSVAYGNGMFVAVADTGSSRVMTSIDGIAWTSQTVDARPWVSVTFGNNAFVAINSDESSISKIMRLDT
jgi:hypothetical protein